MTTDTIAVIVGEIERIEASALAGASAASIGDLSYEQQCQLQSALSRLASQLRSVSDRLAALDVPNALVAEYERWIDFYHAGEGDFADFMRKEFPDE